MNFIRTRHQTIVEILTKFNSEFLIDSSILFGGGTRIALELFEYRESIDIDFLCPNAKAYKAVRNQVSDASLGELLLANHNLKFVREIRADRDAVRTFIQLDGLAVKVEFIHFDNYQLTTEKNWRVLPVPSIDHASCFITKLLANTDRRTEAHKKDIFDLCMMLTHWEPISLGVWQQVDEKYGCALVFVALKAALEEMCDNGDKFKHHAIESLKIDELRANQIVNEYAPTILKKLVKPTI